MANRNILTILTTTGHEFTVSFVVSTTKKCVNTLIFSQTLLISYDTTFTQSM